MAARSSRTPTLTLDPAAPIRWQALTVILALSVLTGLLTLAFAVTARWSMTDRVGLTFLCAWNALLLLALYWRPQWIQIVGYWYFGMGVATGVLKFAGSVLLEPAPHFGPYAYWFPLSYLAAVLLLPPRYAWRIATGVYAAYLVVGVMFALHPSIGPNVKREAVSAFLQFYLSHAMYLTLFIMLARLCRQYLGALLSAEEEARSAYVDALTGLPNRRQLSSWLEAELVRSQVYAEPFSLIVFDLDHFKQVNDTFGHTAGDDVLRATAAAAQGALRGDTRLGRWGGEEFVVLLPRTALADAQGVAERLAQLVSAQFHPEVGRVTASFGVAQVQPGDTAGTLFGRADAALYAAKRAGRARVHA